MTNLSSLVHELRERISASSSTPPTKQNDDALESRFRAVLPNLLQAYVVPSASAKEREVIAVLKLLAHTAKNFPGVFYHGKASAVLPVIGRILPFFAEPAFRSRHGAILEAIGSMLSLLRTADRDAYRQFFLETMSLSEDLAYVSSICNKTNSMETKKVYLKSYCESFSVIHDDTTLLSDLPTSNRPANGYGILIDLTGKERFIFFATSVIKLLSKSLTEGTLYVEGLLNASCVLSVCSLLCCGDDDLHMACFDFACLIGAGRNSEIVPTEKLIQSMTIILSEDAEGVSVFRSAVYDSSLGGCLQALHSGCPDDIVRSTAADLVRIFPESLLKTRSLELKAGLCSAYVRIAKMCPPQLWKPECLVCLLCSSEPIFQLIDCVKIAVSRLAPNLVGRIMTDVNCTNLSALRDNEYDSSKVGGKRTTQDINILETKRQKMDGNCKDSGTSQGVCKFLCRFSVVNEKEYADSFWTSMNLLVEFLKPPGEASNSLNAEIALTAISTLCIVFSEHPNVNLSLCIFRQMCKWISWMYEQVTQELPFPLDLSIFLEAVDSLLLLQGSLPSDNKLIFENAEYMGDLVRPMLKLPWNHSLATGSSTPWKPKCLSIRILSRIGCLTQNGLDFDVLNLGLHDEAEEVRMEAIISMPVTLPCSDFEFLLHMFNKLEILEKEKSEQVKKIIPSFLGHLACCFGCCYGVDALCETGCKLYLKKHKGKQNFKTDNLLQGFLCSKCDSTIAVNYASYSTVLLPNLQGTDFALSCDYTHLQSLFFALLYDESSEEVQVACVRMIQRILLHGTEDILLKTKSKRLNCFDFFNTSQEKIVRQVFCSQISFFLEDHILNCLFSSGDGALNLLQERLKIKPLDLDNFSIPGHHNVHKTTILDIGENVQKPRKSSLIIDNVLKNVNGKQPMEHDQMAQIPVISTSSPNPPRSPFASLPSLKKRILQSNPLRDPFSPLNVDFSGQTASPLQPIKKLKEQVNELTGLSISSELKSQTEVEINRSRLRGGKNCNIPFLESPFVFMWRKKYYVKPSPISSFKVFMLTLT